MKILIVLALSLIVPVFAMGATKKICAPNYYAQTFPQDSAWGKVKTTCIIMDDKSNWQVQVDYFVGESSLYNVTVKSDRVDFRNNPFTYIEYADVKDPKKTENGYIRYVPETTQIESLLGSTPEHLEFLCFPFVTMP